MWTDWIPAGVAVALITGVITIYGVRQNRKTSTETNKLNESDSLIKNLAAEVQRQDGRLDMLDQKVQEQGEQIRRLQAQEWTLKRFIVRLMEKIKELGGEPPDPPFDMTF